MKKQKHTYLRRGPSVVPAFTLVIIMLTLFSTFANAESAVGAAPRATADLRVAVTASTDTVAVGDTVTFTITICNDGPDTALVPTVSRAFPGATLIASGPSLLIDCNRKLTSPLTNSFISNGFGIRFTDTVRADVVGKLSYRAFTNPSIFADPNPTNNDVTVETTVIERTLNGVFQAAGPNAASIQGTVDQFRTALGGANNGNAAGPLAAGRREINWDGGGSTATALAPTPFDGFLNTRGGRFITPGTGFVQAPASGLASVFANPSYANIFSSFSPVRLFSPIGSNLTESVFFVPGGQGIPAATRGFGVVFSDIDLPDGSGPGGSRGNRHLSTLVELIDPEGKVIFSGFAPASPGDGSLSFFGVVFETARIAKVRITAGEVPGIDENERRDVVMMDDFIYGEPQPIN